MQDRFFIFHDNKAYDQGSLDEHLEYLQEWGGTPDMWDWRANLDHAKELAYQFCKDTHVDVIVTNEDWKIVWHIEWNETKQEPIRANLF